MPPPPPKPPVIELPLYDKFNARQLENFREVLPWASAWSLVKSIKKHKNAAFVGSLLDNIEKMLSEGKYATVGEMRVDLYTVVNACASTTSAASPPGVVDAGKALRPEVDRLFDLMPWCNATGIVPPPEDAKQQIVDHYSPPVVAAAPPAEPPPAWRGKMSADERAKMVKAITDALRASTKSDGMSDAKIIEASTKLEEDRFQSSATKQRYTERLASKITSLQTTLRKPVEAAAAPKPHPAKPARSNSAPAWKVLSDCKGVVLTPSKCLISPDTCKPFQALLTNRLDDYCVEADSMLFNPAKASALPGRPITQREKLSKVSAIAAVGVTRHDDPRPVMLAHMDPGGTDPSNNALVLFLYNDGEVQANQVCFEYQGADAIDRAIATLSRTKLYDPQHPCRAHPDTGPMLWSASNLFSTFLENDISTTLPKTFHRFMIVVLPRAPSVIEDDFLALASKKQESDLESLGRKFTNKLGDAGHLFFPFKKDSPDRPQKGFLLDRKKFYNKLKSFTDKGGQLWRKDVPAFGSAMADALERARGARAPIQQNVDDDEEERVIAPKPKPLSSGKRARAVDDSVIDLGDDDDDLGGDSDAEPEDRPVTKKQRGMSTSRPAFASAVESDDEDGEEDGEEEDDESEEEELSADEDEDDEDEDDEDEEDAMEVEASEHAGGQIGDPEPLKKKKKAAAAAAMPAASAAVKAAPKPKPAPSVGSVVAQAAIKKALVAGKPSSAPPPAAAAAASKKAVVAPVVDSDDEPITARLAAAPAPKPQKASRPKPVGQFTTEQIEDIYHTTHPPDRASATGERRRLAREFANARSDAVKGWNAHKDVVSAMPASCLQMGRVSTDAYKAMTALALDGDKLNCWTAIQSLIDYNKQMNLCLVSAMQMYADLKSARPKGSAGPSEGTERAVTAAATNIWKVTPQVAEIGTQLSTLSAQFNSLVAKLNADAVSIAQGMEAAGPLGQNGRK